MNGDLEAAQKRKFWWGTLLAWAPLILGLLPAFISAFRSLSSEKAIGLGGLAGGFLGAFTAFGLLMTLVFEGSAIALLLRTFSKEHFARNLFSFVSLCASGFMIFSLGLFLWFFLGYLPHHR